MSENDDLEIDAYSLTSIHQHIYINVYFIWSLMTNECNSCALNQISTSDNTMAN